MASITRPIPNHDVAAATAATPIKSPYIPNSSIKATIILLTAISNWSI
jgi:hypothetical protein